MNNVPFRQAATPILQPVKLLLLALLGAVASSTAAVPDAVEVITNGTAHRSLYGLSMAENGTYGLAVGDRGTLMVTTDGGETWDEGELDTNLALLDVAIAGGHRLVVGQMGRIYYSDEEKSWSQIDSGTEERLLGVDLNRDGLAAAVGSFGTILVSEDGGRSWQMPDFDITEVVKDGYEAHLNDVKVTAEGAILAVGEFGLILRSTDAGESWEVIHQGDVSLFGLHLRDDGTGFAVGQSGTVLRTRDHGVSWEVLATDSEGNLLGVCSRPDGTVVVPGMRHMIASDDDGQTWTSLEMGDVNRAWYLGAACRADGIYAVGHTQRVIRLTAKES